MARLIYFNDEESQLIKSAFECTVPNEHLLTLCQDLMYAEAERARFLIGSFNFGKRVLANGLSLTKYELSDGLDRQRGTNFVYGDFNKKMLADFAMTCTHAHENEIGVRSLIDRGLNNCFGNNIDAMNAWYVKEALREKDFAMKMMHEDGTFVTRYGKDDYKPGTDLPYPTIEAGLPGEVFRRHILGEGPYRYQNDLFSNGDDYFDREISSILYLLVCVRYIHPIMYEIDLSQISQSQTYSFEDHVIPFGSFVRVKFVLGGKTYERYAMTDWKSFVHATMADYLTRKTNIDDNFWYTESGGRFVISNKFLNEIKTVDDIRNLTVEDVTRIDKPYEHLTPSYFLISKLGELRHWGLLDIDMFKVGWAIFNGRMTEPMRDARNYRYKYQDMPTLARSYNTKDYKWMVAAAAGFVGGNIWSKLD